MIVLLITFVTGSSVAAWEKATSVNDAGNGLEATSAANVRLCTSRKACKESCHKSSTNLQLTQANFLSIHKEVQKVCVRGG